MTGFVSAANTWDTQLNQRSVLCPAILQLMFLTPRAAVRLKGYKSTCTGSPERHARTLKTVVTNDDGRTDAQILPAGEFALGTYELVFHAGDYLDRIGTPPETPRFLDIIPLRFGMSEASALSRAASSITVRLFDLPRQLIRQRRLLDRIADAFNDEFHEQARFGVLVPAMCEQTCHLNRFWWGLVANSYQRAGLQMARPLRKPVSARSHAPPRPNRPVYRRRRIRSAPQHETFWCLMASSSGH